MLTLWTILADTSDNGFLDLGPFATDVGWFVVVASTGGCCNWVWMHLKYFVVFLVLPVSTGELEESLSVSDLSLGPAEELVRNVVLVTDVTALFFLITE